MYEKKTDIINKVNKSWEKIAPSWPLKNFIAVNPLQGLESLPIEQAMLEASLLFEQKNLPKEIEFINKHTIKWLQAFFDEGQATIAMPLREKGLYNAFQKIVYFDDYIHKTDKQKKEWLSQLPQSAEDAITLCLEKLNINKEHEILFLTLMLTTLNGWASYIKYHADWSEENSSDVHQTLKVDYIAMRLIITTLIWENAADLISWHSNIDNPEIKINKRIQTINDAETQYLESILPQLKSSKPNNTHKYDAQIVFCIDVRSEPLRKKLEEKGNYETFGFAGFFGVPVRIHNATTNESYTSCPVLLKPQHDVVEFASLSDQDCSRDDTGYQRYTILKKLYQSLAYNFTTPFVLVDFLGFGAALWMMIKTLLPLQAFQLHNTITTKIRPHFSCIPSLEDISFADQCMYAQSALKTMGLTKNFSSIVMLCGHGSTTENNAYATALDCGACGGHHGGSNAKILAKILNSQEVRLRLDQEGISIPNSTHFIAGEHNTTSDEIEIYQTDIIDPFIAEKITKLQNDMQFAGKVNSQWRLKNLECNTNKNYNENNSKIRSVDWAQVRPEWGLARNASFIVGPRYISKNIDLDGRAFLHSYDYIQDLDGLSLTTILTAPMIVAQWINSQYLFSTIDNVAYGAGSKVTKNITGKFGIMQGNASDLMNGLPLQSIYKNDTDAYHEPVRLMTIVYAPFDFIDIIIKKQPMLQNIFRNGWVLLISIDPRNSDQHYFLNRNLIWEKK